MKASKLPVVAAFSAVSALVGAVYSYAAYSAPWTGAALGAAYGAVFTALEAFVFQGAAGAGLRRLPFLVCLAVRAATYVVLIVAIEALVVALVYGPGAIGATAPRDFAFTLAVSVVANLTFAIADLLGPGVVLAFAAGRYHRPRAEERAMLFVDLCGSTAAAERLGEARFLDFLDAFIVDVTMAIAECGGEIYKYVGDEIIATWRLQPGENDAAVVRACFDALDRLKARRASYKRKFGIEADFRAALHAGVVVLGEVGSFKKEIALIGDAMNTTARILDACRDNGRPVLASTALIGRLSGLPERVAAEPMLPLRARGKSAPLDVVALERVGGRAPEAAPAIGA
jgi:adenylate cyclase